MHSPVASPASPQRLASIELARRSVLYEAADAPCHTVSPVIERSWRRCLAMGLQPDQPATFEAVSSERMAHIRDSNQALIQASEPVIRLLGRAMLHTRYFALLTDAMGAVIEVDGPVDRQDPHARAIARVGVQLSEGQVGTTAIGAALNDLQPVWLHRGEHFLQANSVYSCAGAPIVGPDGRCIGMLDLTGVNVAEQPALKHLVAQSARSIENALTLTLPHRLLLRLNWPGRFLGDDSDGLVCLDGDGYVASMNRAAREMLSHASPGGHCSELFAIDHAALFDASSSQQGPLEVPLWSGLRLQMLAHTALTRPLGPIRRANAVQGVRLREMEQTLIRKAVEDARGNIAEAAQALGISRATLYRKLGPARKSGL